MISAEVSCNQDLRVGHMKKKIKKKKNNNNPETFLDDIMKIFIGSSLNLHMFLTT